MIPPECEGPTTGNLTHPASAQSAETRRLKQLAGRKGNEWRKTRQAMGQSHRFHCKRMASAGYQIAAQSTLVRKSGLDRSFKTFALSGGQGQSLAPLHFAPMEAKLRRRPGERRGKKGRVLSPPGRNVGVVPKDSLQIAGRVTDKKLPYPKCAGAACTGQQSQRSQTSRLAARVPRVRPVQDHLLVPLLLRVFQVLQERQVVRVGRREQVQPD